MLPSNISRDSLPDKFNKFFVFKVEEIRSSFDLSRSLDTVLPTTCHADLNLSVQRQVTRTGKLNRIICPLVNPFCLPVFVSLTLCDYVCVSLCVVVSLCLCLSSCLSTTVDQETNKQTNKTKRNKTKQNKTKQSKAKQSKAKQNKTKQNKTKQNKTNKQKTKIKTISTT